MSTTDTAVAEEKTTKRSPRERATALGPGVVRLPDGTYLKPQSVDLEVRCSGPLAFWSYNCSFELESREGDEPTMFLFPLPGEASLSKLAIAEEVLFPGALSFRSLEELDEEQTVPAPPDSLVIDFGSENQPVFSLQLDSLEGVSPEGTLHLELEFSSGLPTVDGRIHLAVPSGVSPALQFIGETEMSLQVVIEDGNELVDEPTLPEGMTSVQDGEDLKLAGTFSQQEDDVVVTFRPGRTQMPVQRLRRNDEHFIFSIYPPTSIFPSQHRRDIVFAVDASENLDKVRFDQIKEELGQCLRSLDENDRFALVTFGRDIDGYDGGEFCDIEQVEAACEWLEGIEPKGRPDVQPLLQRIQSLPSQEDRQLCIFLLAAGHVGNEPAILKSLDFDQSDRRYYTVGLGQTVKSSFLRRLALLTRGRCESTTNGGCYEAVERLLGQTRALLAEVAFEDQEGEESVDSEQLVPSRMTSLTPQGPVHCLGSGSPASLRFRSKDETGVFYAGTVNAQNTENPALGGVWAGLRVRELLDSVNLTTGAKKKSLMDDANRLAVEYGILTDETVLVRETEDGLEIQYSAVPARWRGADPKTKKEIVSNKDSAAPFDWRKGLVAREGLFKGSKSPGDSGESTGRYGLRTKTGNSSETSAKPRLDRAVALSQSTDDDDYENENENEEVVPPEVEVGSEEVESVETAEAESVTEGEEMVEQEQAGTADTIEADQSAEVEAEEVVEQAEATAELTESDAESEDSVEGAASAETVAAESTPASPTVEEVAQKAVEVSQESSQESVAPAVSVDALPQAAPVSPIVTLHADGVSSSQSRLQAYHSQLAGFERELSLSAIQGLPGDLSPSGGDLARILAQTVAHLEKRGFFSQAVSVLALLLKDNPAPEVVSKMEALLVGWAESLPSEKLPEALQILQLGRRICPGSEALAEKATETMSEWNEQSGTQAQLPEIQLLGSADPDFEPASLLSKPQLELAKLKQEQASLTSQVAELKSQLESQTQKLQQSIEAQFASLPALLEGALKNFAPVVTSTPTTSVPMPKAQPVAPAAAPSSAPVAAQSPESVEKAPASPVAPVAKEEPLPVDIPAPVAKQPEVAAAPTPAPTETPVVEAPDVSEPKPEAVAAPEAPAVPSPPAAQDAKPEGSGEDMKLTKEELNEMLLADPKSEDSRKAVLVSLPDPKERINFFRDMVKADKSEPYHSLSLARAYREAEQTKVAVVHYQKYLRSEKDSKAYLELADAYDELGKANLAASARKAAEAFSNV